MQSHPARAPRGVTAFRARRRRVCACGQHNQRWSRWPLGLAPSSPPQPAYGNYVARALLSGPEGSSEQASGA
eukprot:scaffold28078_cov57-Phaeocystis_antarctica.AAC.4